MIDGDELQPIDEQRFFELVGDAQLVAAVARPQLIAADAHVLVGIGLVPGPGPAQPPISPPPMKSVTNSKRVPFQVKRYGHDEGLRSSSVTVIACDAAARAGAAQGRLRLQDARRPQHADDVGGRARARGRTRHRPARRPATPTTFRALAQAAGAQLDLRADAAAVADARRRAATRSDAFRLPPSLRQTCRSPPSIADHDVGVAVAVEIAERHRLERARPCRCDAGKPRRVARRPSSGRRRCCGTACRPLAGERSAGRAARRCRSRRTAPPRPRRAPRAPAPIAKRAAARR